MGKTNIIGDRGKDVYVVKIRIGKRKVITLSSKSVEFNPNIEWTSGTVQTFPLEGIMSCNMHCNQFLSHIALGFSVMLSDKKNLSVTVFDGDLKNIKQRIRLTRRLFKKCHGKSRYGDIVVTIGKPNYREREFIAKCKKAKCTPRRWWINRTEK